LVLDTHVAFNTIAAFVFSLGCLLMSSIMWCEECIWNFGAL
jgi:hypothetical protein